jgi:hypothetical protein
MKPIEPDQCTFAHPKVSGNGERWIMCEKIVGDCAWIRAHKKCPRKLP